VEQEAGGREGGKETLRVMLRGGNQIVEVPLCREEKRRAEPIEAAY